MKIDTASNVQSIMNHHEIKQKSQETTKSKDFEKFFDEMKPEQMTMDSKVNEMIDDITKVKEMLDYEMTADNLNDYKKAVQSFLEYYTKNELKMDEYQLRDQKGYTRKLNIVKTLDEKVNELTESMLETNQGHLNTLKQVGEIQGLVLNLRL